ncbi:hypothetical protein BWK49_11305 [Mycobacterium intracellulare subsp. chimaera]|nr:hypothetical protein BWK49_11305 [Mycobacterium intracellulare subsp. chimaera]QGK48317.1 hypothetical protein GJE02_11240 [Mycobacterium intracellulare subsp. chimaera]
MSHANACLTPRGRLRLARCVVDDGWTYARGACQDNCVRCCSRLSLGHSGSRSGNWMAKVFSASVQR